MRRFSIPTFTLLWTPNARQQAPPPSAAVWLTAALISSYSPPLASLLSRRYKDRGNNETIVCEHEVVTRCEEVGSSKSVQRMREAASLPDDWGRFVLLLNLLFYINLVQRFNGALPQNIEYWMAARSNTKEETLLGTLLLTQLATGHQVRGKVESCENGWWRTSCPMLLSLCTNKIVCVSLRVCAHVHGRRPRLLLFSRLQGVPLLTSD